MSLIKLGINNDFINLTKTQQKQIYKWARENNGLDETTDDNELTEIFDINLTNEQMALCQNMIQHNQIKALEDKYKQIEHCKKYKEKKKLNAPPKEPRKPKEEYTHCSICKKSVKHFYLHKRTWGHQALQKIIREMDEEKATRIERE